MGYFQGEILKNSSKVQIKVREDSSTLTIIDCTFDDVGMYECRAANNLGTDKTKGSLTVNKMTEQEKAEYEKIKASGLQAAVDEEEKKVIKKEEEKKAKVEKKEEKKKVEKKEEVKKTYDWKKGVKKVEKKEVEEPKAPEKVVLKKPKHIEKPKEVPQEGIKLKPIPAKEKAEQEKKEDIKLKPVPPKEKEEASEGSKSVKVSKKVEKDIKTSKEIVRHQDEAEISRKQEENVKTLAKSISQEDNILKVKDTSSNKRASPEANKLKDAKIYTNSKEEQKDSALKNTSCDAQKSGNSIFKISKNNEIKENDNENLSNQSLT